MFWDYYKKSPKSYPLDIDSWTPTTIEARIPALEGFSDTIPARLEVRKGAVYASHAIQLRPEMEIQIAGDFSNLINVDHSSSDCLAMKDYEQWTVGGYVHRIPKIIHFSTKSTQSSYCQGQDKINLQNLKLPNGYTFYDYQLITTCLSYDASGVGSWHWEGCTKSNAKLDQNLGSIKGKTSLPDVTVSWYCEAYGSGTAYTLTINVEGPKGVVWP
jgi:hypothetical protein